MNASAVIVEGQQLRSEIVRREFMAQGTNTGVTGGVNMRFVPWQRLIRSGLMLNNRSKVSLACFAIV
jgi:hypothetical protein